MAAPLATPARLTVMLSGSGRTLANLLLCIEERRLGARVVRVIASRECPGADAARAKGIPTSIIGGVIPRERLTEMLAADSTDLVALAGYLRLVEVPRRFEDRIVNIHPALLPAFGGPGMHGRRVHEAVLAAGCKVSGCTAHLCDAEYDRGPILVQRACEVLEDDTPETLAARVFELECVALPTALQLLIDGRVEFCVPPPSIAGECARRTARIMTE